MYNDNSDDAAHDVIPISDSKVRVRYRFGDKEMEIEGTPEYVNQHAAMFLSHMSKIASAESSHDTRALDLSQSNTQQIQRPFNVTASGEDSNGTSPLSPQDLIAFFREKSPNGQKDEVIAITYFYQKHLARESLVLEDYQEAYSVLRRLGIRVPNNLKSSVRNVVDRTNLLYNPERGRFALTLQGEQLVVNMERIHDNVNTQYQHKENNNE